MKIGFDAKRVFFNETGLGNYSRTLVHSLCSLFPENEYLLFTPPVGKRKSPERLKEFQNLPVVTIKTGQNWFLKKMHPLWRTFFIQKQVKNLDIDIYHGLSHELPVGLQKLNVKTIVTIHDLIFLKFPQWYSAMDVWTHSRKAKYACEASDTIVAISENSKKDIIHYFGINPEKIQVIYQAVNPVFEKIVGKTQVKKVKEIYNLPEKYIIYVGSFNSRKNLNMLVSAFSFIQNRNTTLVLLGKGPKVKKELLEIIEEKQIDKKVIFLEDVPTRHLPALYRGAEFSVYPSLYEGFGIPVIESLFQNTPVLLSKGAALEEAAGPGGFYTDVTNPYKFAKAIDLLLSNQKKCRQLASAGKVHVSKFSQKFAATAMMNLYKKTLT
ncbi:MAG: glycosyltransferase family 1 protein [Leptospirales bacterium]